MPDRWECKSIVTGLLLGLPSAVAYVAVHPVQTTVSALAWATLVLPWRLRYVRTVHPF